jgi:hypothetical protein
MAIFNRDPQKAMQRDIDAAKANLTRLRAQLAEAEAAIVQHREQAKTAAVTGADSHVLDAAEGLIRNAQIRQETISAAVIEVESNLAALERAKSEAADKAQREATAQSVELLARRVLESAEVLTKAASAFGDHIAKAAAFIPEANGLLNFAHIVGREVPPAVAQTGTLLRQHAQAVLDSRAASSLPQPMQPYVQLPVNKPATVQIFSLHALRWIDHEGTVRVSGKWRDCELPPALAEKAIRLKLAAPMSDPRRQKLVGQSPGHPEPAWLNDLDAEVGPNIATQSAAEPVLHSAFGKPVIGPAKIMQIATTRS